MRVFFQHRDSLFPQVKRFSEMRQEIFQYGMIGYLPAFLYTLACIISDVAPFESAWKVTYGQPHSGLCILNNQPIFSILLGINGPACLLLLISVVNFFIILFFIRKAVRASKAVRNKASLWWWILIDDNCTNCWITICLNFTGGKWADLAPLLHQTRHSSWPCMGSTDAGHLEQFSRAWCNCQRHYIDPGSLLIHQSLEAAPSTGVTAQILMSQEDASLRVKVSGRLWFWIRRELRMLLLVIDDKCR